MTHAIEILKARIERADAKVSRYAKSLESAQKELSDLQTAMRVMADIAGESSTESRSSSPTSTSSRQQEIADLLGVMRENGRSPIDLYDDYVLRGTDEINIDTFRTTIWRMKDKAYACEGRDYIVRSADGEYWKEPMSPSRASNIDDLL